MSLDLYMDVHVRRAISETLRIKGVSVLTAQADQTTQLSDPELLDRATSLGRVLFTQDEDLLTEATRRQRSGIHFGGVIYAHQLRVTVGQCISDLELLAKLGQPSDIADRVEFLPL